MMQSPFALAAVSVLASVLIAVLTVVTEGTSLPLWARALTIVLALPISVGVVWALMLVPKLRAVGRRLAATVGLRAVRSAFMHVNPATKPVRVEAVDDTAALIVPADSRMGIGAAFVVYDADDEEVGVVEVKRIERGEAVCPVVSRGSNEMWNNLEARMDKDDSPPDFRVRLQSSEEARTSAVAALQAWRAQR